MRLTNLVKRGGVSLHSLKKKYHSQNFRFSLEVIMKKIVLGFVFVLFLFVSCGEDNSLKPETAETLIKERLAKMPGRSVSFYLGAMTDPSYKPVYKAIATGKYLTFRDDVYVEAVGKNAQFFPHFCSEHTDKNAFARIIESRHIGKI